MNELRLQNARYGACAVAWNDRVYVMGGSGKERLLGRGISGNVEVINLRTKNVEPLLWQLLPRRYHGAAVIDDFTYIVGGDASDSATLERLDMRTGRVTLLRPMPTPRFYAAAVAVGGLVYVIGGRMGGGFLGTVEVYDPKRDVWETAPPMPTPRDTAACLHNGLIHVVGGFDGNGGTRTHEAYSVGQARWFTQPDMPFALSAHHVAVVGNTLYSFGDFNEGGRVAACDLRAGQWFTPRLSEPFVPRRNSAVVALGDTVVVVGGNTAPSNESSKDTVQAFRAPG